MADSKTSSEMKDEDEYSIITSVKALLQKDDSEACAVDSYSFSFFPLFIMKAVRPRLAEPGRVVCSMRVPRQLVDGDNRLHVGVMSTLVDMVGATVPYTLGAPTSGVSLEINLSCFEAVYLDEEIEIDATVLRVGKSIAVITVKFRKTNTGKLIAQGRHTMYTAAKISRL